MRKRKVKFPVGTLAYYGPDNSRTTKIVAGVLYSEDAKPIIRRYVASDCLRLPPRRENPKADRRVLRRPRR